MPQYIITLPEGFSIEEHPSEGQIKVLGESYQAPNTIQGLTLQDLKVAFLQAVPKDKAKAFAALGAEKCSEVPIEKWPEVIQQLNEIANV